MWTFDARALVGDCCRPLSAAARCSCFAAALILMAAPAAAQMQGGNNPAGASPTPLRDPPTPYGPLQYENDFRFTSAGVSDGLKNLRLGSDPDVYINLGGSLRERFEAFSQAAFGLRAAGGVSGEQYDLHRLLLDADLHLGRSLRVFVQLGNHLEAGRQPGPQPTDIDRLDAQQAFFDATAPVSDHLGAGFRGGRQEMAFGSNRLVDVREGPNIRQSFDGARAWLSAGDARLDAFWTRPTANRQGYFDDTPDETQEFWGAYATTSAKPNAKFGVDLYYLGLGRREALLDAGVADEQRHTVGTRVFGTTGAADYNFEVAYQFGKFGGRPLNAYAAFSDTGYTLNAQWGRPRLGLKADVESGGNSRGRGTLGTFYPLFPKNNYFTEANIQTAMNTIDVYPYVQIQPRPDLALLAGVSFNWRENTRDSFYQPPGLPLLKGNANGRRYLGAYTNLQMEWQSTRNLNVNVAYVHFTADGFMHSAGGHGIDWLGAWTTFNF